MSFILDALKKSETERQQQGGAEFSSVPVSPQSSRPPAWLWLLGALLIVNLAVLGGVMLRPAAETPAAASRVTPAERIEEPIAVASPAPRPADARQPSAVPVTQAATSMPSAAESTVEPVRPSPRPVAAEQPQREEPAPRGFDNLPDIDQLRAAGELPVGELRLDIHVYSAVPADRFVFINMVKHREGSSTSDGLTVDTITPDGVVLDYRGRSFLLPRQ